MGTIIGFLNPLNANWVHVERRAVVIGAPVLAVAGLHTAGELANALSLVKGWYLSPYVAAVAILANRVCVRAGLIATVLTVPSYNFLWMGGRWSFDAPIAAEMLAYVSMVCVAFVISPRGPKVVPQKIFDAGADLPFTKGGSSNGARNGDGSLHGTGRRYWDVSPTGDWAHDCIVGEQYARIYVDRYLHGEPRPALAWVVADMVARGKFGAIETGFMQGLVRSYGINARKLRCPRSLQDDTQQLRKH